MTANERRAEIMRILVARRFITQRQLCAELSVNERTIRRDLIVLMTEYPIETKMGRNGGVCIETWYHPHRRILSQQQQSALLDLMCSADEDHRRILREILMEYGSLSMRQVLAENK